MINQRRYYPLIFHFWGGEEYEKNEPAQQTDQGLYLDEHAPYHHSGSLFLYEHVGDSLKEHRDDVKEQLKTAGQ